MTSALSTPVLVALWMLAIGVTFWGGVFALAAVLERAGGPRRRSRGQLHALPDGTRVQVEVSVVDSQGGGE